MREEAREAVLAMDLSAEDAFEVCKRSVEEGWVTVGDDGPGGAGKGLEQRMRKHRSVGSTQRRGRYGQAST